MQTSENVNPLERNVDVLVPVALISSEVNSRLKQLSRTVKLHGFRPGKVPLKVVAQNYGQEVEQEVIEKALQQRFGEIAREQSLKIAGYPHFEAKPAEAGADSMCFSAIFEVYPEIVPGSLAGKTITRKVHAVTAADVDKTIDILRTQRAKHEQVDRAVAVGDMANIDYEGKIDGVAFAGGAAKAVSVQLGQNKLLPDFEAAIVGMKTGEAKTFDLAFPEDYHGKDVAGKTAQFDITLNRVDAPILPEMNEDFARELGVEDGDMDKVRAEIEGNIGREAQRRIEADVKEQVMQALLDVTKIDLPRTLVANEAHRLADQARADLEARGMKNMPLDANIFLEQAGRRVALGLILAEVVKIHNLKPAPEEVRAVIEDFAQSYEDPQEFIQWHYASPERLADAEALALEKKVVGWALSQATVEDKTVSFEELMGNQ